MLDRIGVLPLEGMPTKRVVAYVVPYVNEPGSLDVALPEETSALASYGASSALPRTLSKLQSLDRVSADWAEQQIAQEDTTRLWVTLRDGQLAEAAQALFEAYVRTRDRATQRTFGQWADPGFRPGEGVLGQDAGDRPALASGPAAVIGDRSQQRRRSCRRAAAPGRAMAPVDRELVGLGGAGVVVGVRGGRAGGSVGAPVAAPDTHAVRRGSAGGCRVARRQDGGGPPGR